MVEMALRSMTGFGTASCQLSGWDVSIDAKSVNHKGLDARVFTSRAFAFLEPKVLKRIKSQFQRGRVDVRIEIAERDAGDLVTQLEQPAALAKAAAERYGVSFTLSDVLALRHSVAQSAPTDKEVEQILDAVDVALLGLRNTRAEEGVKLSVTFKSLIDAAVSHYAQVALIAAEQPGRIRERLTSRFESAIAEYSLSTLDGARFAQELMFYVERCDIDEELQRATSHLDKIGGLVAENGGQPVGKKIDFYLQELNREVNTMGSKTNDSEIIDHVVELKSLVEKMREQCANVE